MIGEKAKPMGPSSRNCLGAIVFQDKKEASTLRNMTFTISRFFYLQDLQSWLLPWEEDKPEVEVKLVGRNEDSWEAGHV